MIKKVISILSAFVLLSCCTACSPERSPETISDLVYSRSNTDNNEVCIMEDGGYEPYIVVTDDSALGTDGNTTKRIRRKVFLLSCNEIDIGSSVNFGPEGDALEYFKNPGNRMAYCNGTLQSWWLRTPNTYYSSCPYVVGSNNKIGSTNAYDENGVRPAFCLSKDTRIKKTNNTGSNDVYYVLASTD